MNEEIKQQWTAALRSGKIQQTKGKLARPVPFADSKGESLPAGRCCLGVLCDLAVDAGVIPAPEIGYESWHLCYGYEADADTLPDEVRAWAGLPDTNPDVVVAYDGDSVERSLAVLNDEGKTFSEIADLIDASL